MTAQSESQAIPFIVFSGPSGVGEAEAMVGVARRAAALDLMERACRSGVFSPVLLATPDIESFEKSLPTGTRLLQTDLGSSNDTFHMGRTLQAITHQEGFQSVLYAGAGAGPLMSVADLVTLASPLRTGSPAVVANNLHSADLVGVRPTSALGVIDLPEEDNGLAFLLWRRGGLPGHEPPRTAATQFDIDSPTDLLIASLHSETGPRLKAELATLSLDSSRLHTVARVFRDPKGQVIIAGRVGSHTWAYLERETACRVRLFSEERGMRALGLEGQARSLLGLHLEAVGPSAFMAHLAELGDAALIDTRVLLAHRRSQASREDRFLSDLGRWSEIVDPFLRDFTQAACEASIPVVLGGHSLVSGGVMALVEAAWTETREDA